MAQVTYSGPLFDGRWDAEIGRLLDDCRHEVAAQASAYVHTILDQRIQHPTPYYETQITTTDRADTTVVHDRGVVYGPWLEGVGSRNFPRTRFRGYAAFRTATQQVERDVPRLCRAVVDRFVAAMNA